MHCTLGVQRGVNRSCALANLAIGPDHSRLGDGVSPGATSTFLLGFNGISLYLRHPLRP